MTNPYIILLSGELRVFDMPDAILCKGYICACETHCDEYPEAVKRFAIKNAIKLDNPELIESDCSILAISTKGTIGRMVEAGNPKGFVPYKEGDQFPLPKGLKVEIKTIDNPEQYLTYAVDGSAIPSGVVKIARLIKEPVKNVLVTGDGSCEAAIKIAKRLAEEPGAITHDEVTMGDAWRSGPEDFSKAIEEQIEKYREMFPDSPIHVLGTVIPPLNTEKAEPFSESKLHETFDGPEITEGAEPSIKLTFYSGKLWHSDKPFPVKPDSKDYTVSALYQADTNYYHNNILPAWLSTAYEVVNPEVIPGVLSGKEVMKWNGTFKDGDQITLPEGYGIRYTINGPKTATITLPEKDKYEVWFNDEWNVVSESQYLSMINNNKYGRINGVLENGDPEKPQIIGVKIKPDVEPSESQEDNEDDCWGVVCQIITDYQLDKNGQGWFAYLERLKSKFTITRRK